MERYYVTERNRVLSDGTVRTYTTYQSAAGHSPRGVKALSDEQLTEAKRKRLQGATLKALAKEYGMCSVTMKKALAAGV